MTSFMANCEQRRWKHDIDDFERHKATLKLLPPAPRAEAFRSFLIKRMREIKDRYPNHQKSFLD